MGENILNDARFAKLLRDPKYREIPKTERKVKIDKRFQSMFNDEKFKIKYTVDKRGRPIHQSSTENLQRFYEIDSEKSSSESDSEEVDDSLASEPEEFVRVPQDDSPNIHRQLDSKEDSNINTKLTDETVDDINNDKLQRGSLSNDVKKRLNNLEIDYARGEGVLFTDSSSDEESELEDDVIENLEHEWGELDADAETTEESTFRLAACNMDWDNMKAVDIMVLFNSFLPPGGIIHKVSVYPSEYGLQRMKEEELRGPIELTEEKVLNVEENEEGVYYHMEKLRKYQLNRLKYFYAVIECDSVTTADKLYSECDGLEYEHSATKLDLRFIGDDITFDQEPREVCSELPDLSKYRPRLFQTTALQQAKVELTWDITDPDRVDAIKNALDGNMNEANLKEYLASSSSDNESAEESNGESFIGDDPIEKYRTLLQDIQSKEEEKKNKDVEMEITWGMGLKEKTEELVKTKLQNDTEMTPFQKYVEKRKQKRKQKRTEKKKQVLDNSENDGDTSSDDIPSDVDMNDPYFAEEMNNSGVKSKKSLKHKNKTVRNVESDEETKRKRAELELLLDDDDGKMHFSLKKIQEAENDTKSKRKRKLRLMKNKDIKEVAPEFEINTNDERFSAIYTSHLYNIDPTDPNFKKTKGMDSLITEKLKRRPKEFPLEEVDSPKKPKADAAMNVLIKSIKRKSQSILNNSK